MSVSEQNLKELWQSLILIRMADFGSHFYFNFRHHVNAETQRCAKSDHAKEAEEKVLCGGGGGFEFGSKGCRSEEGARPAGGMPRDVQPTKIPG